MTIDLKFGSIIIYFYMSYFYYVIPSQCKNNVKNIQIAYYCLICKQFDDDFIDNKTNHNALQIPS